MKTKYQKQFLLILILTKDFCSSTFVLESITEALIQHVRVITLFPIGTLRKPL